MASLHSVAKARNKKVSSITLFLTLHIQFISESGEFDHLNLPWISLCLPNLLAHSWLAGHLQQPSNLWLSFLAPESILHIPHLLLERWEFQIYRQVAEIVQRPLSSEPSVRRDDPFIIPKFSSEHFVLCHQEGYHHLIKRTSFPLILIMSFVTIQYRITHAFSYLISFNLEQFSVFFKSYLDSFGEYRPFVFTRYLSWMCLVFPHEEIQIMYFLAEIS